MLRPKAWHAFRIGHWFHYPQRGQKFIVIFRYASWIRRQGMTLMRKHSRTARCNKQKSIFLAGGHYSEQNVRLLQQIRERDTYFLLEKISLLNAINIYIQIWIFNKLTRIQISIAVSK